MSFKFVWLCELLEELDRSKDQQRATYSRHEDPRNRIVKNWYTKHNRHICRHGPSAIAFLSAVLPERRPDRTYNLQRKRLTQIFGRTLGLGTNRLRMLESWQQKDGRDFPICLEKVMAESEFEPPPDNQQVTLEEIDIALTRIAANNIASAPAIRAQSHGALPSDILAPIIRRLQSYQAKWLVRMILKSYNPVEIPEYVALHSFHFLLPKLLAMQNSFAAAIDMISRPELVKLPPQPSKEYEIALMPILVKEIKPQLGVMIQRQPFEKARSIKHCIGIAQSRVMSVERKYDGEYCQVHINFSKGKPAIQIFSKSGKDSTQDRIGLHSAIKAGLKLNGTDRKIKYRAILEGELLVHSRSQKDILPFHHIRKHVRHGGRRIGVELDSPKKPDEYLMIAFFDILMLDDRIMLNEPHQIRRAHLKGVVSPIDGEVLVVERVMIDFASRKAADVLRQTFSHAIKMRWEGFVLKGLNDPYVSWKLGHRSIKLKKDYIAGLGDSADLCIIGGHRDPKIEVELAIGVLSWTTFYVACLMNKSEVKRFQERPTFQILDRLGPGSMSKDDILTLNAEGKRVEQQYTAVSEYMVVKHPRRDIPLPTAIFTKPMVVEVFGAGYERPQTVNFYFLRFPRRVGSKIKIHRDRDIADTVDFVELQNTAEISLKEQATHASQEDVEWINRLLAADPRSKYIFDKSQSTSPSKTQHSATTASLTPAGPRLTSTQPSPMFVRVDSDELTPTEHNQRYPDSAPQTPNRTESVISPNSTRTRETVSQRDFAILQNSPTERVARKRKRVEFEPTHQSLGARTMSDITNMAKPVRDMDLKRTCSDFGKRKKAMVSVSSVEELAMSRRDGESNDLATSPREEEQEATVSTESMVADARDTALNTVPAVHETIPTQILPQTNVPSPARLPVASMIPHLIINQPIFLTSSLTTDKIKHNRNAIVRNLNATKTYYLTTPQIFADLLFDEHVHKTCSSLSPSNSTPPPFSFTPTTLQPDPNPIRSRHPTSIALISTAHGQDRKGAADIRHLIDLTPLPDDLPDPQTYQTQTQLQVQAQPNVTTLLQHDILIFDASIMETTFWKKAVVERVPLGERDRDDDDDDQKSWKKAFVALCEVRIRLWEDENKKVGWNVVGQMFWE